MLIESGGLDFEAESQALARGKSVGEPYLPLVHQRSRLFGSTSLQWKPYGGWRA